MSEVAPGIQLLPIPTPFPVGPVNVYLLEGQPLTLVDVGPRTPEAMEALRAGLSGLGYSLPEIEQVVITHAHHDHFGQARDVVEASGATLLSFRENTTPLEQFETWWQQRMEFVAELMLEEGAPPESLGEMEIIKGFTQYAASVSPVRPLDDNDELPLGRRVWRVLHTPGHARGEVCLYHEREKLLFSGDHLLRDITANPVLETPRAGMTERPRSLPDYIKSLRRIRELEVEMVLPGHGGAVYDHRALVDEILTHHQVRGALILQLLRERGQTVYELGVALFGGQLPGVELFLVMSEIIGHLDVLELEGKVERVDRGQVAVWRAIV